MSGFVFDVPPDGYVFPPWKDAFVEACQDDLPNTWSTGAAYNARMRVGPSRCKHWADVKLKVKFRVVYEGFCNDILRGVALPRRCFTRPYFVMPASVKPKLPPPVVSVVDRDNCTANLKGLKDLLS